jgi:hypothetical protein
VLDGVAIDAYGKRDGVALTGSYKLIKATDNSNFGDVTAHVAAQSNKIMRHGVTISENNSLLSVGASADDVGIHELAERGSSSNGPLADALSCILAENANPALQNRLAEIVSAQGDDATVVTALEPLD